MVSERNQWEPESDLDVPCGATDASQRAPSMNPGFEWSGTGIRESLLNHCQQQLVALFTPVPHPGRSKVHPGGTVRTFANFG